MAAQTVRDLLSTTSVMFDKSEALNGELLKFVRAAEGRRAGAEAEADGVGLVWGDAVSDFERVGFECGHGFRP